MKTDQRKDFQRSCTLTNNDSFHRWLIFLTASLSMMLDIGFMFSFGTLYVNIMSTFSVSRSAAAMVQSILMAVRFGSGMVSGAVVQRFGTLQAGVFGSFLASTGLVLSYFASSVIMLDITIGTVLAFGSSCLYIASSVAIGQNFSGEKRHILMSIQSAAGGLGGMIFPFVLKYLSDNFGLKGTLLIVGGIYLQLLPVAFLWGEHRFKRHRTVCSYIKERAANNIEVEGTADLKNNNLPIYPDERQADIRYEGETSCIEIATDTELVTERKDKSTEIKHAHVSTVPLRNCRQPANEQITMKLSNIENIKREPVWKCFKQLVCNPAFVIFAIGLAVAYPALGILFIFIVDLFIDAGLSEDDATFGLLLVHMFSIFGRLLPGLVMQSKRVPAFSVPIGASIVTSAAMAGLVLVGTLKQHLLLLGVIGIPYGVFVSVFSVTTLKIVGIDRLSNAIGVHFTLNCIGSAMAGPICGSLRDSTGSYSLPFWIAAGVILFGAVMFTCALLIRRKSSSETAEEIPLLRNQRHGERYLQNRTTT